jgi:hypothetical protein
VEKVLFYVFHKVVMGLMQRSPLVLLPNIYNFQA